MMVNKYVKVGKALYKAGKKKLSEMASKTSPSAKGGKTKAATSKPPVKIPAAPKPPKPTAGPKPKTIDFSKAKKTLAGTAAVGAGVGYMAGKADNKKPEVKKPEPKKFSPKKEETKTYQDAKLNKSNAPMPDFTPKKVDAADKAEAPKKEEFDRMQAARDQMKRARESMGMGSRFGYKKGGKVYSKDGCAVRGKTKGKLY